MGGRRFARALAMVVAIGTVIAVPHGAATAGGRGGHARVLPPAATPFGYSREDMTGLLALFTTSNNNPAYYPDTPFQILYTDPARTQLVVETLSGVRCAQPPAPPGPGCGYSFGDTGDASNTFTVTADQSFFVPVDNADDSPTIVGEFPTTPQGAKRYLFDHRQLDGRDFAVIIDGRRTSLGPAYVAGPVETAPLLDGGGTHMITIGAFIGPMSPGTHTVRITGGYFGDILQKVGLAFIRLDFTYEVVVTR
jgi:hypothetical protein